jgi:hypothetical protein
MVGDTTREASGYPTIEGGIQTLVAARDGVDFVRWQYTWH